MDNGVYQDAGHSGLYLKESPLVVFRRSLAEAQESRRVLSSDCLSSYKLSNSTNSKISSSFGYSLNPPSRSRLVGSMDAVKGFWLKKVNTFIHFMVFIHQENSFDEVRTALMPFSLK